MYDVFSLKTHLHYTKNFVKIKQRDIKNEKDTQEEKIRMNKYQEALKFLGEYSLGCAVTNHKEDTIKVINKYRQTLQELVDKATPKIPYYLNYGGFSVGNWKCRSCDGIVKDGDVYCKHCGQALDRSGEDV